MGACCARPTRLRSKLSWWQFKWKNRNTDDFYELKAKLHELFDLCDKNNNNKLSLEEIRMHLKTTDVLSDEVKVEAKKRMEKWDEDRDGKVSQAEFMKFFLSDKDVNDKKLIDEIDDEIAREELYGKRHLMEKEEEMLEVEHRFDDQMKKLSTERRAKLLKEEQKARRALGMTVKEKVKKKHKKKHKKKKKDNVAVI